MHEAGLLVCDPGTIVFSGAMKDAGGVGLRIHAEAMRNGLYRAERLVVLADGAT